MKSLFFIIILSIYIYATDSIKIVYNAQTPPLKFTNAKNEANGLIIDIWKLWAKRNNIQVQFIEAPWDETIKMIKTGQADINASIFYTEDRDKYLDFSDKPLFNNKKYFFYHNSLGDIAHISDLKPYVIAIDNGYPNIFMKENYPDYSINSYESSNEANRTFLNGEAKVVLSSLTTFYYNLKRNKSDENQYKYSQITYAYEKQYFGAVKQGNKRLLEKINNGFKKISDEELKLIELKWTKELDLVNFNINENTTIYDRDTFLQDRKEINMCVDPNWFPLEEIDNGKHVGMIADIYKEFEKELGFKIKLIPTNTWTQSLEYLKQRKCDILSAAAQTNERKEYMNFTKPYLTFPEVMITRDKEPFVSDFKDIIHKKIGVVKNSAIVELLKIKYPKINLVETEDVADGLFKVSSGELYGFINTTTAVSYAIAKNGMTHLKVASRVGIDYYLRVGIRNDAPKLLDTFNHIITNRDKTKIKQIKEKWLTIKFDENVDYSLIYKILVFFIFILLLFIYWNRKLKYEIHERKIAQEELHKFSQIIEQSHVSIMLTSRRGIIEYVNPYYTKETGYSYKESIGKNPRILNSGYQDASFYDNLWKTIFSGRTWNGEFCNKKKNGEIFWESAIIAPIFDDKNEIKYFASIKENITEKVQVLKELEIAQKEAIKANNTKSDFLAKMSHEIRTPMNAVLGMLYLLEKSTLSLTQENYIKKANNAANSLLGVINDILDFSKIEANKLEIKYSEFNIHSLINDTMSVMSVKAQEHELELLTYYDNDVPMIVISDKLRVSQILNNLISNAIKFTKKGEILISTRLINKSKTTTTLMFSVKDSGIGISKDNQKKLFQEFSQVDESATRSFHGTGLGLAISKKLSSLLGGKIWIENSQEGIGTTVCFTIKVQTQTSKQDKNLILPKTMSHLNVLVVDDNILASKVLRNMLESFHCNVDHVYNGLEAIQEVQKKNFDMIFLDYKMPGLNGIETYKRYKKILKNNTPKTLMVTAYSQEILEKEIEKYGIIGYLTKPISPSTLYNSIINSLNNTIITKEKYTKEEYRTLKGINILLAEDNNINQEFAVALLESNGINVEIANNGLEVLEKIKTKEFNLILMDIQMPKMDGLQATKCIRKIEDDYFKKIPIIALSANALVGDKEKSIEAGMNEHITKPINPKLLFDTLKIFIDEIKPIKEVQNIGYPSYTKLDSELFDVTEAINRMGNNEKAYLKILNHFSLNYQNIFEDINNLIDKKDINNLERKIHELKGIAGNIAAKRLFINLSGLNTILINNKMPSNKMFLQCQKSFQDVIENINNLNTTTNVNKKEFDKKIVIELLLKIDNYINKDIVLCEEYIDKLIPYLEDSYKDFSLQLTTSFDDFDTVNVSELIKNFLKDIRNNE